MKVNGNTLALPAGLEVPDMIGIRTREFEPLLRKWRSQNKRVPWSELLRESLRRNPTMQQLAGKRYAHLVEPPEKERQVAA